VLNTGINRYRATERNGIIPLYHILYGITFGTHENERTVLYKTKSLDGVKPNTNPKSKTKTNPNPNTNPKVNLNPKLTKILTLFSCFMLFRTPSHTLQSSQIR